ncbi:hypothetical protein SAMN05421754_101277 [Nitrosomonas sp. Nm58]|nr:hypothetical protein SAMN05421754_101277 [Nitrosomonas sp. Nm58]
MKAEKKIVNLAVAMRQREWIDGLWNKSKNFISPLTTMVVVTTPEDERNYDAKGSR